MKIKEEWKDITIENVKPIYQISNIGRIKNKITDTLLIPQYCKSNGYLVVRLMTINEDGTTKGRTFTIHRLVAKMFVQGETNELCVVDHIDCNKLNNVYTNLEWVSHIENTQRANDNGLVNHAKGTDVGSNVLSEDDVRMICELLVQYKGRVSKICDILSNYKPIQSHLIYQIKKQEDMVMDF